MKVYLDLIFLLNFIYDFLILLTTSLVLKRKICFKRCLLGSFLGMLSMFLLVLKINNFLLFLLKILASIIIILSTFKYVSLKYFLNNLTYFYMISIILSGFLYFLNITFSLKHEGFIFFFNDYSINAILLIIIAPVILYFYYQSTKKLKTSYNMYYHISLVFDDEKINMLAFFDNGNNLKDPVTQKAIIIVDDKVLSKIHHIRSPMYVPFNTINNSGLMKCYKPSYIVINNKKIYNYLIGSTAYKFKDGVKALLNNKLWEDGYV